MKKLLHHSSGWLCAAALFAIMVLTFFDVGGRKFLSQSIPGSLELTELLMVVVIFAGLPLVSERGEHVVFDSLDGIWPNWFLKAQRAIVNLLCAAALLALGWLMWKTGAEFGQTGETTAQMQIPKAPFIYLMGVMSALTGLVHLGQVFQPASDLAEGEGAAL
ncbi:MAG: hypothetical protein RL758_849 [Pseudomonadota bacterium]|jgi:TRAP-type transport system small permease protein